MGKFNKTKSNKSYIDLTSSIESGEAGNLYIFHGEERYLLDHSLLSLRNLLCPDGLDGFNYKRYEGKEFQTGELEDAVDTLPVFAERTMIEIHDFNIFKLDDKQRLCGIFADLPEYVCIVFVFGSVEYKPDSRLKLDKEILKYANVIEFTAPEQENLIKWIKRHFRDTGKIIGTNDALYLAEITGGLMTTLNGEIEKVAAYSKYDTVTRNDINMVVSPVLDAVAYRLTDAIISREKNRALRLLDELFQMREAPHKLLYSISLKMRQLLTARICAENNPGKTKLMYICGIKHDFQADLLLNTAKKATLSECRNNVLHCSETALELNSITEPESRILELVLKVLHNSR